MWLISVSVCLLVAATVIAKPVILPTRPPCSKPIEPENGHVTQYNQKYPNIWQFGCNAGFVLDMKRGEYRFVNACQRPKIRTPNCIKATSTTSATTSAAPSNPLCPTPEAPQNGYVQPYAGDWFKFICMVGYDFYGDMRFVKCNQRIAVKPICVAKPEDDTLMQCVPPSSPPNGFVNPHYRLPNIWVFSCADGFELRAGEDRFVNCLQQNIKIPICYIAAPTTTSTTTTVTTTTTPTPITYVCENNRTIHLKWCGPAVNVVSHRGYGLTSIGNMDESCTVVRDYGQGMIVTVEHWNGYYPYVHGQRITHRSGYRVYDLHSLHIRMKSGYACDRCSGWSFIISHREGNCDKQGTTTAKPCALPAPPDNGFVEHLAPLPNIWKFGCDAGFEMRKGDVKYVDCLKGRNFTTPKCEPLPTTTTTGLSTKNLFTVRHRNGR